MAMEDRIREWYQKGQSRKNEKVPFMCPSFDAVDVLLEELAGMAGEDEDPSGVLGELKDYMEALNAATEQLRKEMDDQAVRAHTAEAKVAELERELNNLLWSSQHQGGGAA
jgi:hypothetical protein